MAPPPAPRLLLLRALLHWHISQHAPGREGGVGLNGDERRSEEGMEVGQRGLLPYPCASSGAEEQAAMLVRPSGTNHGAELEITSSSGACFHGDGPAPPCSGPSLSSARPRPSLLVVTFVSAR